MNADIKDGLTSLRSQEWFREFVLGDVMAAMPSMRSYNPADDNSVEQWKADSMRREGYLLCLQQFGYSPENLKGGPR